MSFVLGRDRCRRPGISPVLCPAPVERYPQTAVLDPPQVLPHHDDRILKWTALFVAVLIHLTALSISVPSPETTYDAATSTDSLVVRRYVPPPPIERERRLVRTMDFTRRIPLPDPTPGEPEPVREPSPELRMLPLPADVEFIVGTPVPPPLPERPRPLRAGIDGCPDPVLIQESYVRPQYPEPARLAHMEAKVILEAVIRGDGTVGDCRILRCTRPDYGFEESTLAAIRQWRYRPAIHQGRPVDVLLTVFVDYEIE